MFERIPVLTKKLNSVKMTILIYFYNTGQKKIAEFQELTLCIYLCDLGNYIVTRKWRHRMGSTSNLVIP